MNPSGSPGVRMNFLVIPDGSVGSEAEDPSLSPPSEDALHAMHVERDLSTICLDERSPHREECHGVKSEVSQIPAKQKLQRLSRSGQHAEDGETKIEETEVMIPCEICSRPIPIHKLDFHQMECQAGYFLETVDGEGLSSPLRNISIPLSPNQDVKSKTQVNTLTVLHEVEEDESYDTAEEESREDPIQAATVNHGQRHEEPSPAALAKSKGNQEVTDTKGSHAIPSSFTIDPRYEDSYNDPALLPYLEQLKGLDADSPDEEIMERLRLILSQVPEDDDVGIIPCQFCHSLLPFDEFEVVLHQTGCGREVFLGAEYGDLWIQCRSCSFSFPLQEIQEHEDTCRNDAQRKEDLPVRKAEYDNCDVENQYFSSDQYP
ncbi:unnamed protein product [Darwinula stevensoni]|uniref:Uncharacterized protein n=1 Tax=Darwinula stevensoni TaxID=69355 RepID=A0A7R9AGR5_9CRUS|nr:unnamed protein product [Darwinula stevensoni]CAG0904349.1 unnamed protein product [Darwinula stevensoni]